MVKLTVSLEDGFSQDHVLIRVDGTTAYEDSDVTTRTQTGFAAAVRVDVPDRCHLEVALPGRGLARGVDLDAENAPYVRISLVDGDVAVATTAQPPYYA